MLWNVFVFYAEHAKQNAPKPARDWKSWFPSRGRGASGGGTNKVTEEAEDDTDPPAAAGHGTSDTIGDLKKELEAVKEALRERNEAYNETMKQVQEIEKQRLERDDNLKEELAAVKQELKECLKVNEEWSLHSESQAQQYSSEIERYTPTLHVPKHNSILITSKMRE